ncbi:tripartite tricarboxylate transporter substrate binding protein [Sporosarcina sp. P13]|uniref:Bug family tripartite tricarboxylate transporter substrate binding protein n=1 Tax=Sporosarcina sp. P13 TaxID=2048263 RepID=UPI001303FB43|nr:tripartite tricarboxylate transporter substrate binding protein [Sporosarcina sp. P13]
MIKNSKRFTVLFLALVLVILTACNNDASDESASSGGADYPKRPISLMIPYGPGGSADVQARLIGQSLQTQLGQTVNVISKPGGAGATGMNALKASKPDGYTIILTAVGPSTLTPNANNVGFNVVEDFYPIAQISEAPYGIAVNSDSGIESLDELLNFAKENPGKATFGTTGAGLHQHVVTTDFLNQLPDVDMEHVPFDGGAEAVSALLGNHITAAVNTISEIIPHAENNALKILAVTTDERLESLPDVPTFKELGYELIGQGAWFGFMAPKDTPKEIVDTLDGAIKNALDDDKVKEQFENAGLPIKYLNAAEFKEKVQVENEKNGKVIQSLN